MNDMEFIVINGKALQILLWASSDIPEDYAPLDGRTIEGITLPDRRDKWLSGGDPAKAYPDYIVLREVVRMHDLKDPTGNIIIKGVLP